MKSFGIILVVWGIIGVILGQIMFGDIGISCTYTALTSIIIGIAFIKNYPR